MAQNENRPMAARPGRWLRWALVVSLGVNLLVAGVMVGGILSHGSDGRGGHRSERTSAERQDDRTLRAIGNLPFVMALSREDRAALAAALRREADPLSANRERLRERFEALLVVLRADPFDPGALRDLLERQRAILFERQQLGEALLIDHLSGMGTEARQAYADRLDRSLRRGPPGRGAPPDP